jgi:Lon protease-like protein
MQEQFGTPLNVVSLARIQAGSMLILARCGERVVLPFVEIGKQPMKGCLIQLAKIV